VRALEAALKEGHMPSQFAFKDGASAANGEAAAMDED
jgi:hypothetical protein